MAVVRGGGGAAGNVPFGACAAVAAAWAAVGALNLFHARPAALPVEDLALGQGLADVATISIMQEQAVRRREVVNEQLQTALNSRVVIEQAKGVLAQHTGQSMNAAFDRLRGYARRNNLRLSEVARELAGGALDPATIFTAATSPQRRGRA